MNLSLFPKNEEWGTGDEALDLRLSNALKKAADNLSLESISEFYFFGMSTRPRAYNPMLSMTIELVTKALLFHLGPEECNDFLLKKLKGHYFLKEKISFELKDSDAIVHALKKDHKFRYRDQIDFYFTQQNTIDRNPFVQYELKRSPYDLQAKIIFKEFKSFLNEEVSKENHDDLFFKSLKGGKRVLVIEKFAEIWYDRDQLFSISLITT